MADFVPPYPIDLFHLGQALTDLLAGQQEIRADRGILITNQDAQQTQLTAIVAAQAGQVSAISSSGAQQSANIAEASSTLGAKIDSLTAMVAAQGASLSAQNAAANTNLVNLTTLLQAMIQAFQGVATLAAQNHMSDLLTEIIQSTSPERPRSLTVDRAHPATTPQPRPAIPGP